MKRLLFTFYFLLSTFLCSAQYNVLLTFTGPNGENPLGGELILSGNVLYGMTGGETKGDTAGNVFSIHTDGTHFKQLLVFNGANGSYPTGGLTLLGNMLYGMTSGGNNPGNDGNVFCIDTNGNNYKNLLTFNGTNGNEPLGNLTLIGNVLYGMTFMGGAHNLGDIFSIHTDGNNYKDLFDFSGTDGAQPEASFTLWENKLYGMTTYGGVYGAGVIFCIDTDGNGYRVIYDFSGGNAGSEPFGDLTLYDNKFYGMTVQGGSSNYGNIFSIYTNGSGYKDIFNFNNNISYMPFGSLIYATGVLFGTVQHGGAYGNGVIFSIDTDGSGYKDLYDFTIYGEIPGDNLTLSGNILYGMANNAAGTPNFGVLFSFKDTNEGSGISELKGESGKVKVCPNPSNGIFQLQITNYKSGINNEVKIYNVLGQQVYRANINSDNTQINLSGQPQGIYLYRVITETGELIGEGKVVKE